MSCQMKVGLGVGLTVLVASMSIGCAVSSTDDARQAADLENVGTSSPALTANDYFFRNTLSGLCLDAVGAPGTANGTPLALYSCELSGRDPWGNPTDQAWHWVAAPAGYSGFFIQNSLSGKCLDVSGAPGTANGTPLALYDCELSGRDAWGNTTDQLWRFVTLGSAGYLIQNTLSNKCVDVSGAPGTASGTPLALYNCETTGRDAWGNPTDQLWTTE